MDKLFATIEQISARLFDGVLSTVNYLKKRRFDTSKRLFFTFFRESKCRLCPDHTRHMEVNYGQRNNHQPSPD